MSHFRRKTDDLNNTPFDPKASPEQKAKDFDRQYANNQNKAKGSIQPEVKGAAKKEGKHRK